MHENKKCKKTSHPDVDQPSRKWHPCQCKNGCAKNYAGLRKKASSCSEVDCAKKSSHENETQWKFRNDFREPCQHPYYHHYLQESAFPNYCYNGLGHEPPFNAYQQPLRWNLNYGVNAPCSCYHCWHNQLNGGMNLTCKGGGYGNCVNCTNRANNMQESESTKLQQGKVIRNYMSQPSLHNVSVAPLRSGTKNYLETASRAMLPFYCSGYNPYYYPPYNNQLMANYYLPVSLHQHPGNYPGLSQNVPNAYNGEHVCPNAGVRSVRQEPKQYASPVQSRTHRSSKCSCINRDEKMPKRSDNKKLAENPNNYYIRYSPNQEMTLRKKESLEILRNEEKCHDTQDAAGKYRYFNLNCNVLKD